MSVIVGTTISGTYADGPGLTMQSHLIYAVNAQVWWLFTVTSASDAIGNPGTHIVKAYVSSSYDLATSTWTAKTDSPNFDASSTNTDAILEGGRNFACLYRYNPSGVNKDIVLINASMQRTDKLTGGNSYNGINRAVVTKDKISWSNWGGYVTPSWNNLAGHTFRSGEALGRTADGFIQVAGMYIHSEVDAAALCSLDPDTGDDWTTGGTSANGTVTTSSASITLMTNQTNLKVGMGLSQETSDWNVSRYPKVNTINTNSQVTMSHTVTVGGTGSNLRWWQFGPGSNRIQLDTPMLDTSMTNECQSHAFANLAQNGCLCVYETGAQVPPNVDNFSSRKANQTKDQGFWPATSIAAPEAAVFSSTSTQDLQDWCCVGVDTTHIYVAQRSAATTIRVAVYTDSGVGSWALTGNQPPAMTGKVIKAGGGIMGITDNINMWLFVIDSTDAAIKYVKFNVAAGTWDGAWTTLESVSATATKLSGQPLIMAGRAGLIFTETNGSNFDTRVTQLQISGSPTLGGGPYPDMTPSQRMP